VLLAFPAREAHQFDRLEQFPADFVFDDFAQSNVRRARWSRQAPTPAETAGAGVSWRTRREIRLIRTLGLPTFSRAFLQSSEFTNVFGQNRACQVSDCLTGRNKKRTFATRIDANCRRVVFSPAADSFARATAHMDQHDRVSNSNAPSLSRRTAQVTGTRTALNAWHSPDLTHARVASPKSKVSRSKFTTTLVQYRLPCAASPKGRCSSASYGFRAKRRLADGCLNLAAMKFRRINAQYTVVGTPVARRSRCDSWISDEEGARFGKSLFGLPPPAPAKRPRRASACQR
jgi:hypothetical protein